ncbi:MAG: SRPBCC domain-containing protein [Pseudomonadota bacterium]|nr:SRPBCC domain-containing protein [Pseudomonadota bacterium]
MTIEYGDFTLTRTIGASPASVFRAFAEEDLKRQWFVNSDGPDWATKSYTLDFRVGGTERGAFRLEVGPGAGMHENATTYFDIVEGQRIAYAYSMAWDGRVHSTSLVTVQFDAVEAGCRLTYTEHGAFFPPSDGADMRKGGVTAQLDALAAQFS